MKIAIISDLHLNISIYKGVMDKNYPTIPFRQADMMRSFKWMCQKCINDIKPDIIVIAGDVYDNHVNVSDTIRGFFSSQLKKLADNNIQTYILIGNHDVCMRNHVLQDIGDLKLEETRVIEKPTDIVFKNETRLLLFPYSLDVERKKIKIKDELKNFIKEVHIDTTLEPLMFCGHFPVQKAKMNEYNDVKALKEIRETTDTTTTLSEKDIKKKEFRNTNPNDISNEDLDSIGVPYVLLGDLHEHQVLETQKCYSMYTGSIEKSDMTEIKQVKGFVLYDSDEEKIDKYGKCRFIEYPNCRPIIEMKGTLTSIRKEFSELDHSQYQGAIVKITFNGTTEEQTDFSAGLEGFKREVKAEIDPIHLFHFQAVKDPEQDLMVSELEKEIMNKGHLSDQDVIDVVKEIIKERIEDKKEVDEIIKLAIEIHEEVNGA